MICSSEAAALHVLVLSMGQNELQSGLERRGNVSDGLMRSLGEFLNVPARVGTFRAIAPQLGEVEHLPQARERSIGIGRPPARPVISSEMCARVTSWALMRPSRGRIWFLIFISLVATVEGLLCSFECSSMNLLHSSFMVSAARAADFSAHGSRPRRTLRQPILREFPGLVDLKLSKST